MRIPRDEVARACELVHSKVEEIADEKNIFEMIPCGSYRRYVF